MVRAIVKKAEFPQVGAREGGLTTGPVPYADHRAD